jgi:hypothetical protein
MVALREATANNRLPLEGGGLSEAQGGGEGTLGTSSCPPPSQPSPLTPKAPALRLGGGRDLILGEAFCSQKKREKMCGRQANPNWRKYDNRILLPSRLWRMDPRPLPTHFIRACASLRRFDWEGRGKIICFLNLYLSFRELLIGERKRRCPLNTE